MNDITGCEFIKCKYFVDGKCNASFDYVNRQTGEAMCHLNSNSIPKESYGSESKAGGKMKFGDIIENGWASASNPFKYGIFVKKNSNNILLTDMDGEFWEAGNDKNAKNKVIGNILLFSVIQSHPCCKEIKEE